MTVREQTENNEKLILSENAMFVANSLGRKTQEENVPCEPSFSVTATE